MGKCQLQARHLLLILHSVKTAAIFLCSSLLAFLPSCAPAPSGLPEDQPTRMRLHRTTSFEDLQESERTRGGGVIATSGERDWNF